MVIRMFVLLLLPQTLLGLPQQEQSQLVFSAASHLDLPANATLVSFKSEPETTIQHSAGHLTVCSGNDWESLLTISTGDINATLTGNLLSLCSGQNCQSVEVEARKWDVHPNLTHSRRRLTGTCDTGNGDVDFDNQWFVGCIGCAGTGYEQPDVPSACYDDYCPKGCILTPGTPNTCTSCADLIFSWTYDNTRKWDFLDDQSGTSYGIVLNLGTVHAGDGTAAQDDNDPSPVQSKGYYFDGTDDQMYLVNPELNSNFSFLAWFRIVDPGGNGRMSLVHLGNSSGQDEHELGFDIIGGANYNLWVTVGSQEHLGSTNPGSYATWTHVVWSVNYSAYSNTIRTYISQLSSGVTTLTKHAPYHDVAGGEYIMSEQGNARIKGLLYHIRIEQRSMDDTTAVNGSYVSVSPWNCDFDTFTASCTGCNAACTQGCIRNSATASCNCYDVECKENCTNFDASATCTDDTCTKTTNSQDATDAGGVCLCIDAAARRDATDPCEACITGCVNCTQMDNSFEDCTLCDASHYATEGNVCETACPSGSTDGGGTCSLGGTHILGINFNVLGTTYTNTGADVGALSFGITTTQVDTGSAVPSAYPQKNRGVYFNGSSEAYVKIDSVHLWPVFTVHQWVRRTAQNAAHALFSKDRGDSNSAALSVYLYIGSNNKIKAEIANHDSGTNSDHQSSSTVAQNEWKFLSTTFSNTDGYRTVIQSWIDRSDNGSTTCGNTNNEMFVLDSSSWPIYVAIDRTNTSAFTHKFEGFMFEMHVWQEAYDNLSNNHYSDAGCPANGASTCSADGNGTLEMWNSGFAEFTNDAGVNTVCTAVTTNCQYTGCYWPGQASTTEMDCVSCSVNARTTSAMGVWDKYCNMCYDRECASCSDYPDGNCNVGACGLRDGEDDPAIAGYCKCKDTYSREDTDSGETKDFCWPCHTGCGICTKPLTNPASFRYCSQCALTMKETSGPIYCFDECPTGFDEAAAASATVPATCSLGAGGAKVVTLIFSAPTHDYTNTGAAEAGETAGRQPVWAVTRDPPGGVAAKYRGIYFDNETDNYGQITLLNFNRIVSVHMWMMLKRTNVKQTAWSVDRNSWAVTDAAQNIDAFITNSNGTEMCVARDDEPTTSMFCKSHATNLSASTWYYIVWVLEDLNGYDLQYDVYLNAAQQMNDSQQDLCFKDNTSWPMNIAIQRTSNGSSSPQYNNKFQGFISVIAIWQETSNGTGDHWVSGGADACSDCDTFDCAVQSTTCLWKEDFDKFQDWWQNSCTKAAPCANVGCHTSCRDTGCVNHEACKTEAECIALQTNTGDAYCNLCYDRECANCATYGIDDCTVCGVKGNATLDGTTCVCDSQWGRIQSDAWTSTTFKRGYYCRECWTNCETCKRVSVDEASSYTSNAVENYAECYECKTATFSTGFLDGNCYYYCQTEEPTAEDWATCFATPSSTSCAVLSYTFVNSFTTFANSFDTEVSSTTNVTPNAVVTAAAPSGLAGSYRGIWFATSNTAYIGFDAAFTLRHTFAIYSWVWYDDGNSGTATLFSKDRNASADYVYKAAINSSRYMVVTVYKDSDGSVDDGTATQTTNQLTDREWVWLSISNECNNHKDTTVRFYTNANAAENHTVSDKCLDDEGAWYTGAFIGSERTAVAADVFANQFSGFIYDFHLYQRGYDAAEFALYRKTSSCGWSVEITRSVLSCPDTLDGSLKWENNGTNDMWQTYYNKWTDTLETCDASCTTTYSPSTGCNREAHCIDPSTCEATAVSGTECHMCYDYHCTGCTDHHMGSCDTGCRGTSEHDTTICQCANNFEAVKYTRRDRTSPCCQRHCARCMLEVEGRYCIECCAGDTTGSDGECVEVAKEMPGYRVGTDGFIICNVHCPSGFNNSVLPCTVLHTTLIADWDLTWITRPMYNYATNYSTSFTPNTPPGGWTQFGDALPYKLRGSWFGNETTQRALVVDDPLQFHHTFTMAFWVRMEATSGDQTLFSKDKGDPQVNATSDENVWEFRLNAGSPVVAIWRAEGTADWESVTSASAYISGTSWYFLAFSLKYNGIRTTAKLYKNTDSGESVDFNDNIYVLDRQNWDGANASTFIIGSSRSTSGSDPTPETPFSGWIFYTKIWIEERSQSDIQTLIEGTASNCIGGCTQAGAPSGYCPTPSSWYVNALNYCLWEVDRDKWEQDDGTARDCYLKSTIENSQDACPAVQGCQRDKDCNRCNDRLCKICNTFDDRKTYCTTCINNAVKITGDVCGCNDNYWYNDDSALADPSTDPPDYTDECVDCDVACKKCASLSYKDCTECRTGYFKQEAINTCLNLCPTGYTTWSSSNDACEGSPGTEKVFEMTLTTWSDDFKTIQETKSTQYLLQLGQNDAWEADDPWFDRAATRSSIQFTAASNQLILIKSRTGADTYPGLLLSHDFTIMFWIRPSGITGSQTLLSKTNETSHVTSGEEDTIAFGLNAANIEWVITSSTLTENPTADPVVEEDFTVTTYVSTGDPITANEWVHVSVTMVYGGDQADVTLFKNGVQAHAQTAADAQFSDYLGNVNWIGCGKALGSATPENCYDGRMYEMKVYAINLSGFLVLSDYSGNSGNLPDLTNDCAELEYYDTVGAACTACGTNVSTPGQKEDTIAECTMCNSILCNKCTSMGATACTGCLSGHTLSSGTCICSTGNYFDGTQCTTCPSDCTTCHGAYPWRCTVCTSGYYLQPDTSSGTYTCADVCPKGYKIDPIVVNNQCINDSSYNTNLLLDFNNIANTWIYDGVTYVAGQDSTTVQSEEPWTYKNRGAYFDGTDDLCKLDGTFYLYAQRFTFMSWIRPEQDGSIFSKSYNDYSADGSSDFFDVRLLGLQLHVDITAVAGEKKTAAISGVITVLNWNFISFTMNYDRTIDSETCTIAGYTNGQTRTTTALTPTAILEKSGSESAIGARLDSDTGNLGSSKLDNFYKGFIYNISLYGDTVSNEATMNGYVTTGSTCSGGCTVCPSSDNTCLWNCETDEFQSASDSCEACPVCPNTHPNLWDGCVRAENCALCDDPECATCNGFSSSASCSACITSEQGDPITSTSDCVCPSGELYNSATHACAGCNSYCTSCTGFDNFTCDACTAGNYKQTGSTTCLPFCPTGWTAQSNTCDSNANVVVQLTFDEITKGMGTTFPLQNTSGLGSTVTAQNTDSLRSIAVKDRGHYFSGDKYWEFSGFNMHHTFTIVAWIRPTLSSSNLVLFSKQKSSIVNGGVPAKNPLEDLMTLLILYDNTVESLIFDLATLKVNNISTDNPTSLKWQMIATRAVYSSDITTLDVWINATKQTSENSNGVWFGEYDSSVTLLGAEWNHDGTSWVVQNNFVGFFYKFQIWNENRSDSDVISEVQDVGGDICPNGTCISECNFGQWIDGGNGNACTNCDAACTDGNCVRAATDNSCTLCDNMLCLTCQYFVTGNSAKCMTCATNGQTTSPPSCTANTSTTCSTSDYDTDCVCVDTAGSPVSAPSSCTCTGNCDGCTELDNFHCIGCQTGYFKQDSSLLCFDYCGFDYTTNSGTKSCDDTNSGRISRTFDQINWSAASTDPWPMRMRGVWFDGSTHFLTDSNSVVFHHTMVIDAFIRPKAVSNGTSGADAQRTIFSRNKSDNSSVGAEDFVSFYLTSGNALAVSFTTSFTTTVTGSTVSVGSWEYVAVRWLYTQETSTGADDDNTTIHLIKRGSQIATETQSGTKVVEDNTSWTNYIGREDDSPSSAAVAAKFFSGFMYQMGWANKDITYTDVYKTSGCTRNCTNFCPASSSQCLSDCEYLEWPEYDALTNVGSCNACHASCTTGCTRDDHCSFCIDGECEQCTNFELGATCSQCYTGITDSSGTVDCVCNDYPTGRVYLSAAGACLGCHAHCDGCESRIGRTSLYDCGNDCITNYAQHGGLCEDYCPTGYTDVAKVCTDQTVATDKLVLHFNDFTLFVNTDTDKAQLGLVGYRGTNENFNDAFTDAANPRVQYYGGLHFDGTDVLKIPPYDGNTASLLMNMYQTVVMIIRPYQWSIDNSSGNEVLLSKSDGTNDKWMLYLEQTTKILKLKMTEMKFVVNGDSNADNEVSFAAVTDDGLWHALAIVSTVSAADETQYVNTYKAYLDGVQLGSDQTISDYYYYDNASYFFTFGGNYANNAINPSYRGNLYDLKIYNEAKNQAFLQTTAHTINSTTNDPTVCACNQCYDTNGCLTHCAWNQYLVESAMSCFACPEGCGQGCWNSDACTLNSDPKCGTPRSWTECSRCIDLASVVSPSTTCECVTNAKYYVADSACKCNLEENYYELTDGSCVACYRYLLPNEVVGYYSDDYHYLQLDFTSDIRTDFFTNLSCSDFVDSATLAKLGSNPLCQWYHLDEANDLGVWVTLKVTPGANATFAEENFIMKGETLYTSEVGNCPHAPQTINPLIYYPIGTSPPAPIAYFTANTKFSKACDDLYLDASGSTKELHRTMIFSWDIRYKTTSTQVATYLATPTADQTFEEVTVPRSHFVDAGVYTVTLTVTNWGLKTDTKSLDVTVLSTDSPVLKVEFNAETRTLNKSDSRELDVNVTNNCTSETQAISYSYQWSLVSGPASITGSVLSSTINKITLNNSFSTVGTYIIQVDVSGGGFSGEARIELDIVATPLIARLNAPNGEVSLKNQLELDSSASSDPDGGAIDYYWSCSDSINSDCGQVFIITNMNQSVQTIAANKMTADVTYVFSLTVTPQNSATTGDTRSSSTQVTVTAKDNDAPSLLVKDIGDRVAPQDTLRLQVTPQSTTSSVTTSWTQTKGPTVAVSELTKSSSLSYLVIEPNKLVEGDIYRFELQAQNTNLDAATAAIEFTVNIGPRSGTFYASPASGTELTTDFSLAASGWIDPEDTDYPLLYGYKYIDSTGAAVWLQRPLDKTVFITKLPYLGSSTLTVELHAVDSLQTAKTTQSTVTVYALTTDEERTTQITTALNELGTANTVDIPGLINTYAANDQITEDTQLDALTTAFDKYLADIETFTPDVIDTAISAHKSLCETNVAINEATKIEQYAATIAKDSEAAGGLTRTQGEQLLENIRDIGQDPAINHSTYQSVLEMVTKSMLPEQNDFTYSTSDIGFNARRTTPSSLVGSAQSVPNSGNQITLPSSILNNSVLASTDTNTLIDARLTEYAPVVGRLGTQSSVVDYTLVQIGHYQDNTINYLTEQVPIEISNTEDWIEIQIQVDGMHTEFNPDCVYASKIDELTGTHTWSYEGCQVSEVRRNEGTVVCQCNHLSRFTAGEELVAIPIDIANIEAIEKDDDDDIDDKFPIMLTFLGFLIVMLVVTAVIDYASQKTQGIHAKVTSLDPLVQISDDSDEPRSKDKVVALGSGRQEEEIFSSVDASQSGTSKVIPKISDRSMLDNSTTQLKQDITLPPVEKKNVTSPNESPTSPNMGKIVATQVRKHAEDSQETPRATDRKGFPPVSVFREKPSASICSRHLVFGKCSGRNTSVTTRAFIVCGALIFEICLTGIIYLYQYDVEESYEDDWTPDDIDVGREVSYGALAAAIGVSMSFILTFIYAKKQSLGFVLSVLLIVLSSAITIYMAIIFNKIWSLTWMFSWLICAAFELIVGQVIIMCVAASVFKVEEE